MQDFDLNKLQKDMNFLEESITVSNANKKKAFEIDEEIKVPKKVKNLRYFLKKKRNIIFKNAPTSYFSRSKLNTTMIESNGNQKHIRWTIELAFVVINENTINAN